MEYLSLGKIIDSFGIDGTVKIYSTTSFGSKRYKQGSKVFIVNPQDQSKTEVEVVKYRHNSNFDFVKFAEYNTPEEVKELKESGLFSENDCLDMLSLLSHLFRRLDVAKKI